MDSNRDKLNRALSFLLLFFYLKYDSVSSDVSAEKEKRAEDKLFRFQAEVIRKLWAILEFEDLNFIRLITFEASRFLRRAFNQAFWKPV